LVWGLQKGEVLWRDEDLDAARSAGLAPDQASTFESEDHLVDGGRGDAEMALDLTFGRGTPIDARVGIDERQILTLFGREAASRFARHLI